MTDTSDNPGIGTWQDYVRQPIMFTEAVRGGPLVWPAGSTHLHGDPLGPVRHVHDGAAEYYYVLSGACLVEVGGEERVASEGDLVYIPADAPHNLLHEVGGVDAWTYIMVAPNFAENKWRTTDLLSDEESPKMSVTRPLEGDGGAAANPFPAEVVTVARGTSVARSSSTGELVYLVVEGECHFRSGALSGNLRPGHQVHVLRDLEHEISALSEQARLLCFSCAFVPFAGVELGPDGEHHKY
jgi:quercetin dioxygenase-like cupin family protein